MSQGNLIWLLKLPLVPSAIVSSAISLNWNMLTVVLILNLLIAGLCWYAVWRIWQLRRALARVTAALTLAERSTDRVLNGAPAFLIQGQVGAYRLHNQYQQVLVQFQQVKQILSLLGLGQLVWQRWNRRYAEQNPKPSSPSSRRSRSTPKSTLHRPQTPYL